MPSPLSSLFCCFRATVAAPATSPATHDHHLAPTQAARTIEGLSPRRRSPPIGTTSLEANDGPPNNEDLRAYFLELEAAHRARSESSVNTVSATADSAFGQSTEQRYDRSLALQYHPALTTFLDELEQAYRQNREPVLIDHPFLDDMLRGLNLADPAFEARRCEFSPKWSDNDIEQSDLAACLRANLGTGRTTRLLLDGEGHRAALSVRCAVGSRDVSMVLVDSFSPKLMEKDPAIWAKALSTLSSITRSLDGEDTTPARLHLAIFAASTQKTLSGCSIFAISALKKMVSDTFVDQLHNNGLLGIASNGTAVDVRFAGHAELPPSFMKHTTSSSVVKDYLERSTLADRGQAVNRKGETLQERYQKHVVTRGHTYSNSFEVKRIELVRTALHHLTRAPQAHGMSYTGRAEASR